METLIELYDERPLENVLGVEMFRPSRVIYLCPEETANDFRLQSRIRDYFRHRKMEPELVFETVDVFDTDAVKRFFDRTVSRYPGCSIDITGGTDAVLFAAGLECAQVQIPVFTYSRRKNRFYNIMNAPFADGIECNVSYTVEDCFRMAGGAMRTGRVDNALLSGYRDDFDPFFALFLNYRRDWINLVTYMQKVSPTGPDGNASLQVNADYYVKGERGSRIAAKEDALEALQSIGFLKNLKIRTGEAVSFCFRDPQIRIWLRDVGSVLELYVYQTCLDLGIFDDVRTSAVVDWEGSGRQNDVTNELDVMCTQGVTPVFISCKTCEIKTEALNELAILRDRFGGQIARAAIVTAEHGNAAMRNRALELGIHVIDIEDLSGGRLPERIQALMR